MLNRIGIVARVIFRLFILAPDHSAYRNPHPAFFTMPIVKPTCIRDLKFRVNIVDVVSRVAMLKPAGSGRFKGLCPFHNEKTPSFHVDSNKGFYKCFGCGKAGDIFTFIQETEQLSFVEAVETLGKRYGVPVEYEEGSGGPSREERSLRQELFDLHETAAEHFHQVFKGNFDPNDPAKTGEWMRAYWQNVRRFAPELADEFKIGAAAPDGSGLFSRLYKEHHTEEALRKCGLFFVRDNEPLTLHTVRPRFRGRLMIPIRDHQGRVVAFTARATDLTPADDPAHEAKYVNSPETPIFTKGNIIFNLDRARAAVGPDAPFVLVEGQLDALRCWSVGIKTAIAFQGTAITEPQLALLRRYHTQVECLLDSDAAGQKAALRYLPLALKAGLESRFLALASATKLDPDLLFLEHGPAAYDELRQHALSAMAFACRGILPDPAAASAEQKTQATRALFDLILNADSDITRAQFLEEIRAHLHLATSPQALINDFDAYRHRAAQRAASATAAAASETEATESRKPNTENTATGANTPEYHLLLLCLHNEHLGPRIAQRILDTGWIDRAHTAGALLEKILNHFAGDDWPGRDHLDEYGLLETDAEKALAATLLFDPPKTDEPLRAVDQALTALRNRALLKRKQQIELALAAPHEDSNGDNLSLLKELTNITRQLRQPLGL